MQTAAKKISTNDKCALKRTAAPSYALNDTSIIPFDSPAGDTCIQQKPTCACGGGCPGCINPSPIQAKSAPGQQGNDYEQEAGIGADRVMKMVVPQIRPKPT
ncbi:MAG: hypothetical protein GY799_20675 [Desulfobulbaceae bacterium]|nr:hypothetical protein [Desulfobulbaceae bacterium]